MVCSLSPVQIRRVSSQLSIVGSSDSFEDLFLTSFSVDPTASDSADVLRHREQFSALSGKQYFNYGGQGPMADSAIAALDHAQRKIQTEGPVFSCGV